MKMVTRTRAKEWISERKVDESERRDLENLNQSSIDRKRRGMIQGISTVTIRIPSILYFNPDGVIRYFENYSRVERDKKNTTTTGEGFVKS
jgi:hypothetical protein